MDDPWEQEREKEKKLRREEKAWGSDPVKRAIEVLENLPLEELAKRVDAAQYTPVAKLLRDSRQLFHKSAVSCPVKTNTHPLHKMLDGYFFHYGCWDGKRKPNHLESHMKAFKFMLRVYRDHPNINKLPKEIKDGTWTDAKIMYGGFDLPSWLFNDRMNRGPNLHPKRVDETS